MNTEKRRKEIKRRKGKGEEEKEASVEDVHLDNNRLFASRLSGIIQNSLQKKLPGAEKMF